MNEWLLIERNSQIGRRVAFLSPRQQRDRLKDDLAREKTPLWHGSVLGDAADLAVVAAADADDET